MNNPLKDKYYYVDHLQSERLVTRFLTRDDSSAWIEFMDDKEATQFFPDNGYTSSKDRAVGWIEKQLNRYADKQFGLQALINKNTNEFIGQCGLLLQHVNDVWEVEVGYHILKKHWGQGYAPEAARLFIRFAFENNITDSVISIIHINNLNSQRVAEKNGLKREKQIKWKDLDVFIYRIARKEFELQKR